jgi:hypothetical protein
MVTSLGRSGLLLALLALAGCAVDDGSIDPTNAEENAADERAADEGAVETTQQALDPNKDDDPFEPPPPPPPPPAYVPRVTAVLDGMSSDIHWDDGYIWFGSERQVQLYGTVSMRNVTRGTATVRNMGTWGNADDYGFHPWTTLTGPAPRVFDTTYKEPFPDFRGGWQYTFADAKLCTSTSYTYCSSLYTYNNHKMTLVAYPGDAITIAFHFKDYDEGSADDDFCRGSISGKVTGTFERPILSLSYSGRTYYGGLNGYAKGTGWDGIMGDVPCGLWLHGE